MSGKEDAVDSSASVKPHYTLVTTLSHWSSVSQLFLLSEPIWCRKIFMDRHILAHVDTAFPNDRCEIKKKNYVLEMIVDSCRYMPVKYFTMQCE